MTDSVTLRFLRAQSEPDRRVWLAAWQRTTSREPFCHPDYGALFAGAGTQPGCVLGQVGGIEVILPVVVRDLRVEPWNGDDREVRELALPVGYGGAYLCGSVPAGAGRRFWAELERWARAQAVVCAHTRLSLYPDEILPVDGWTQVPACDNVVVDLAAFRQRGIAGFTSSLRRNVRQAERAGVVPALDSSPAAFRAFRELYRQTMERRQARRDYRFSEHFFQGLATQLDGGFARLFTARDPAGDYLSAELVLLGGRRAFAFLAGSNGPARRMHAHELLRSFMCRWLADRDWSELVLGGGNQPGDPLFAHKLRFAPDGRRPYRKARRIYDHGTYGRLVRAWQAHGGAPGEFPGYRG